MVGVLWVLLTFMRQTKSNDRYILLGEDNLAWDILEQLSHVERFDMVVLFMSSKEKEGENVVQSSFKWI